MMIVRNKNKRKYWFFYGRLEKFLKLITSFMLYLYSKMKKMKSPFPGMNPWLEGYIWPDVHNHLAGVIKEMLAPQIAPKYVARLAIASIKDYHPEYEMGITYPDIEINKRNNMVQEPVMAYGLGRTVVTEPTYISPFKLPIEQKISVVEIRDAAKNKLVTAIEIVSPVNKRNPNLIDYRKKIDDLHRSGVHIVEIDLLRRGTRTFYPDLYKAHYQMSLLRAGTHNAAIWAVDVKDELPVLPIPLLAPDPDAILDIGKALEIIWERSLYYLSIDYKKDPIPPPVFSEQDTAWIQQICSGDFSR
jgi:Protein of unknown function (DUF4058)